jgi:Transglycosylase SLT domain
VNAGPLTARPRARACSGRRAALLAASAFALVALMIALAAIVALTGGVEIAGPAESAAVGADAPSSLALREIPARYLQLYERAAARYGIDWAVLAGIGKVECDHGRDPDAACSREGAVNAAGAGGPMQFIASTWARYGVDGDADGRVDRWDAADAIFSAANYLSAAGAPRDYERALLAYNHARWYVAEVESWAARYRASAATPSRQRARGLASAGVPDESPESPLYTERREGGPVPDVALQYETSTPVRFVAGERAMLSPADAHVALIPASAPAVVEAMVVAGNELQQLPYGPAGHPDPRGAPQEDCSSTVNYVLYRSGVRPIAEILRENPRAQDYVRWGVPGPGRWVTIYATTAPSDHVFIVIAGLRLDTSHDGTDAGPNRDEDGPRWRLLDGIPTWAHWTVRHPPGL